MEKATSSSLFFFGIGNNFLSKTLEENIRNGVGTVVSVAGNLNFSYPEVL
ncbi:hypothetical protein [Flavicella sp.]